MRCLGHALRAMRRLGQGGARQMPPSNPAAAPIHSKSATIGNGSGGSFRRRRKGEPE